MTSYRKYILYKDWGKKKIMRDNKGHTNEPRARNANMFCKVDGWPGLCQPYNVCSGDRCFSLAKYEWNLE